MLLGGRPGRRLREAIIRSNVYEDWTGGGDDGGGADRVGRFDVMVVKRLSK